jgi:hypothetical protein
MTRAPTFMTTTVFGKMQTMTAGLIDLSAACCTGAVDEG